VEKDNTKSSLRSSKSGHYGTGKLL
jgi:hypothetical protein